MKDDRSPEGGQARSDSEREGTEALSRAPTVSGPPASARPELRPVSSSLTPGQSFGPYQIHRLLGKGGMGEVYEAEDTETHRRVALKVLSQTLIEPEDRARFLREGRLAASVSHPNSVYVYGTAEIDGIPVISMEFVASGTLKDRVLEKGPMPASEAVDAILQVINGLEAASSVGVLHRDIKPSNCFLDEDGTVKVGDFGLSISTLSRAESHLTATGTFMGTPSFASPEQLRCEELDVRSDIYSVGATLFYLLTGRAPFEEERLGKLIAAVLERAPDPVRRLRPDLPKGLERVTQRCLQKQPASRFAHYADLRMELLPFGSGAPTPMTLGVRVGAGVLDILVLGFLESALETVLSAKLGKERTSFGGFSPVFLAMLGGSLLYYTLLEGLLGASIGKEVLGLRVRGPYGGAPGLPRALIRSSIWVSISFTAPAVSSVLWHTSHPGPASPIPDLLFHVLDMASFLLLFVTARRANGFAGLHELASGTRVVRRTVPRVRMVSTAVERKVEVERAVGRLGPYLVLEAVFQDATESLLLGYDEQLHRRVWIRTRQPGAPAVSTARRDLSRSGRLRWLNGRRSAEEAWDAYEAPDGCAFLDLVTETRPWTLVRQWLLEMGEELTEGMKEESLPPNLGLENLWVTRDGRAKLLDFPVPVEVKRILPSTRLAVVPDDLTWVQRYLSALALTALAQPPTVHARALLDDFSKGAFRTPESLMSGMRSLAEKPPRLSRWRRVGHLAACGTFVFLVLGFIDGFTRAGKGGLIPEPLSVINFRIAALIWAALGVMSAAFFEGGFLLNAMRLAVVGPDGRQASERRSIWRAVVAWSPWLIVPFAVPTTGRLRFASLVSAQGYPLFIAMGVFLIGTACAIATPERGLQDRIAGTYLVPK